MKVDLAQLKTSWGGVLVVLVDKLNTQNPRRRKIFYKVKRQAGAELGQAQPRLGLKAS